MPPQFTVFLRNTPNKSDQRLEFRRPVGTKQSGQLKVSKAQSPGSPAHPHCGKQPSYPVLSLGRPAVNCLRPRLRRGPRRQAGPDESREARLRSGKAAAPPGWALERATGAVQRRDGGVADRPAAAVLSAARSDGEMRVASETPGKAEERCSGQTQAAATWRDTPTRRRRSLLPRPNWSSSQHEPGGAQRPEAP